MTTLHSLTFATACLALVTTALCSDANVPAALPSADSFFKPADFKSPKLSPGGNAIAALTRFDDRHYELTLITLPAMTARSIAKSPDKTVQGFWWKNDDLLLLLVEDDQGGRDFRSLDLRTGKFNQLDELKKYLLVEFISELPDDPDRMLFKCFSTVPNDRRAATAINLKTGEDTMVEESAPGISTWMLNRSGEVVSGLGELDRETFVLWRAKKTSPWNRRTLAVDKLSPIIPLGIAPDQHRLIVVDYRQNPTGRICYYDPADEKTEEVVGPRTVEPKRLQFWGRRPEPAAIIYETDHDEFHFLNAEAEAAHRWLEKALPGTERDYVSFSRDNSRAIVFARQDRNPGVYCLLEIPTQKLKIIWSAQRALNPTATVRSRPFNFVTSDHETVTGRITLPAGIERPPLIIATGPKLNLRRLAANFDAVAQFFTSRGYAVARVNSRGTAGFGREFSAKGDFQIGTGMARDQMEAATWLAGQNWVDGKRMAILGEEWGGVVAFACATEHGPFRALINWDSPLDLADRAVSTFSVSGRSDTELFAAAGGKKIAQAYGKSISPLNTAAYISVPSFHSYSPARNGAANPPAGDVKKLESLLKKRGLAYEMAGSPPPDEIKKKGLIDWSLMGARGEAAVIFLNRHMGNATSD